MLMGSVPSPQTQDTFDRVKELVAASADRGELLAISNEIAEFSKSPSVSKRMPPNTRTVKGGSYTVFRTAPSAVLSG